MKYSPWRREAILRKLLPPNNRPVAEVAEEEGISDATLYNWRSKARKEGKLLPDHGSNPEGWSSRDKFNAVLETAALSESEVGEYCRKRGLYPEQIHRWRQSCETANDRDEKVEQRSREAVKQEKKRTRQLERELKRKEAALAETAALLTLRKKAQAIWGDEDD
ncbi:Transposase [Marinobacter segnicrescens]|uniref:Transposase n=1 Tax=Marinobacter segnicrescens TaxID=430453 RepID=A0A1I0ALG8_9GAMM|nr:Transposase [Marinobacter segnicrescens]